MTIPRDLGLTGPRRDLMEQVRRIARIAADPDDLGCPRLDADEDQVRQLRHRLEAARR